MDQLRALTPYAHWLLRLALASVFLYHGLTKFPVLGNMAEMMGMPVFMVALIALFETAGGALILAGGFGPDWATRLGGLLITPVMLGAIFMVHWGRWNFITTWSESGPGSHPMGGMEFQFTLLMIALYFLVVGNAHSGVTTAAATERTDRAVNA